MRTRRPGFSARPLRWQQGRARAGKAATYWTIGKAAGLASQVPATVMVHTPIPTTLFAPSPALSSIQDISSFLLLSLSSRCHHADVPLTGDASRNARSHGAAIGRGPFLDCWFTLAALEHDFKEKVRMHDLIRQAGGRIFDAKRVNLVANASSAYAVCPLGFPPSQCAEVLRQPDFRMGETLLFLAQESFLADRFKRDEQMLK